eukprot:scaffold10285_cov258-Chaetoceros_neogracile.AAC.2
MSANGMNSPDPANDFSDPRNENELTPALVIADSAIPAEERKDQDEDFNVFAECAKAIDIEKINKDTVLDEKQILISADINVNKEDADDPPTEATFDTSPTAEISPEEALTRKRYVTPHDFLLLKVIGMGAFGKVLQVKNKTSKEVLAMKIISKRLLNRKSSYVENINVERDILTKIRHPFIVRMHCSFQSREKLFIIMDFLAGGELFLRLGREGIFLESTAKFYIGEIVLALEHLHARGILHRDLKPENILLCRDGHLCITDFGLAKDFRWEDIDQNREDGRALTICGTQEYMAPEMVAKMGYSKGADWWSLGCIAYEMLAGEPPFQSKKGAKDLFRKIMNERVRMPDGSSAGACKLLKGLLNRDASARLGATKGTMFQIGGVAQVKELNFFAGLNWTLLEKKEIDPPMTAHVDNDEDLRHFYDEFTKMRLPRSVKEMTDDDFKPKQIKSKFFKGFSFIQHDFQLPDRTADQDAHYWNNPEHDGESASECASLLDEDYDTKPTQMKPSLESTPENTETPSKKKRPPRKKKKKGQAVSNAEEATSPIPTSSFQPLPHIHDDGENFDSNTNAESEVSVNNIINFPPSEEPEEESQEAKLLRKTIIISKKEAPPKWTSVSKPKPKLASKAPVWGTVGTSSKDRKVTEKPGHSLKMNAKSWTPNNVKTVGTVPGTRAIRSSNPASQAQSASLTDVRARPSTDWRDHKLQSNPALKPQMKQPSISDTHAFPSLGDFPSINGLQKCANEIAKLPHSKDSHARKSTGAWGKR